jgi:predicted anti-sigma-YlaC factor YlaD
MDCKELAALIPDMIDGTLEPAIQAEAETALENCPECRQEYEIARQIRTFLTDLQAQRPDLVLPAGFEARLLERIRLQNTGVDFLDLSSKAFGLWLIEIINLIAGLLNPTQAQPQKGSSGV